MDAHQLDYRVNMLENDKSDLENKLKAKDLELHQAKDTIRLLEDKCEKAESDKFKEFNKFNKIKDDTDSEFKLLKQSIKNSNEETKNHKKTLAEVNKNENKREY
jgi:hypothetical protein